MFMTRSSGVTPDDQIYMILEGIITISENLAPMYAQGYVGNYTGLVHDWQGELATGSGVSFAEYVGGTNVVAGNTVPSTNDLGSSIDGQEVSADDLEVMLPAEADLLNGLVEEFTWNRNLEEVAANYTDPGEADRLFQEWGWQGNSARGFSLPEGAEPGNVGITAVYASIHLLGDDQSARDGVDYSVDDQAGSTGAKVAPVQQVGDYSRGLVVETSGGTEGTIYVQDGPLTMRVTVVTAETDPLDHVVEILTGMLARSS